MSDDVADAAESEEEHRRVGRLAAPPAACGFDRLGREFAEYLESQSKAASLARVGQLSGAGSAPAIQSLM